jgi:hypothetical protein
LTSFVEVKVFVSGGKTRIFWEDPFVIRMYEYATLDSYKTFICDKSVPSQYVKIAVLRQDRTVASRRIEEEVNEFDRSIILFFVYLQNRHNEHSSSISYDKMCR